MPGTGPKAKIEIEIDDAEARRQMERLRADFAEGGRGTGGVRPRVPGGGPRNVPSGGGGGGGAGGGLGGGLVGVIVAAVTAALVPFKDAIADAWAPVATEIKTWQLAIARAADQATGTGERADKSRAEDDALRKVEQFGRDTFGKASPQQLQSYAAMQFNLARMQEQGGRAARNAWVDFRRPMFGVMR